ncbi:MAG: hypothetical protein HGGPFJEG_01745 [Ignavibacteria bacterium]|nr:hypothetical protein [Ignavibacteria bacterium]
MRKIILIILILLSSKSFSQSGFGKFDNDFKIRFDKPTIELSYGISHIRLGYSDPGISDAGMFEIKLGFTQEKTSKYSKQVLKYKNRFLFLSNASDNNLSKTQSLSDINNTLWRFGFGNKSGYGVLLGSVSILPYSSGSASWTEFNYNKNELNTESNYAALDDFAGTFRFGTITEAGVNIQLFNGFSLEPKYEISDIYPRHLFFENMTSLLVEAVGLELLNQFSYAIMKNSPVAGSFVNFILKNAYEYGFYQLRKDNMNWPFTSTAPLRYNTFKLGMSFIF